MVDDGMDAGTIQAMGHASAGVDDVIAMHTLSLTPDYVAAWAFWEAIRELLQNAIDQSARNADSRVAFEYDRWAERLTVGATHCRLSPRTLLLGVTDKAGDRRTLGQFGEGYKLALLVLMRSQYEIIIRNGDEVWVPRFVYSDEYESTVLTVTRYRAPFTTTGVTFEIRDVSEADYGMVCERYLPDASCNAILRDDFHAHKVFVGGLFVCEYPDLEWGYNFAPDRMTLDRDRGMVSEFEATWEASRLWDESDDTDALYKNLREGGADTKHVKLHTRTANQFVLNEYLKETPDCIPVATDVEARALIDAGNKVRRVPQPLRDALRRLHDFACEKGDTPGAVMDRFQNEYKWHLPNDGRKMLAAIVESSKRWAGSCDGI